MNKPIVATLALVALLIVVIVSYVFLSRPIDEEEITIGFNTWVGYGPLYIAQKEGFFEKRGLRVSLRRMEGTGERRSGLIANRLQGAGSTVDDLVISRAQGVPIKMVLALDESDGADGILVSEGINSVSDLKGKTCAVQPGFVNHFFLLYVLDRNGLTSDDVTIKPMDPDAAAAAFASKHVDVAVTWEPHLTAVKEARPDSAVLLRSGKNDGGADYSGVIVDVLVFREDFIEKRPQDVQAFVDAWYEATEFLEQNQEKARRIIADEMGLEPEEAQAMLANVKFLDRDSNVDYHDKNAKVNVYAVGDTAARLWKQENLIESLPRMSEAIDASFIHGSN